MSSKAGGFGVAPDTGAEAAGAAGEKDSPHGARTNILRCQTCNYYRIQDVKRDWYGDELKILAEIHQRTFKDHVVTITELSDEELRAVITNQRKKIAAKKREQVSAIDECMKELSKLERNSLELLWREYSS